VRPEGTSLKSVMDRGRGYEERHADLGEGTVQNLCWQRFVS